jgi:hypothetical protein
MNTEEVEEQLSELDELINLMFSENVTEPELIAALRQYVAIKGADLQPLTAAIKEVITHFVAGDLDEHFESLAHPNLLVTLTSTLEPEQRPECYPYKMTEGVYTLRTDVSLTEFQRVHYMDCGIYLPEQVAAEFQRKMAPDGSNVWHGHSFDTKIAVQIYNDYREIIIDANATLDADSIELYGNVLNAIAKGASDAEISALLNYTTESEVVISAPRPRP